MVEAPFELIDNGRSEPNRQSTRYAFRPAGPAALIYRPGETLWVAVQKVATEGQLTINTFDLTVFALFVVLTIAAFRLRWSYGLLAVLVLVPSLLHVGAQFPLMSFSRYALTAFPCFMVLALWVSKRPRIVHLLVLTLWVSLMLVWASQFVRGYWVG